MRGGTRGSGVLLAVLILVAGCQATSGRTVGQWWDDTATTSRVKTALAASNIATLTRVDVDTVNGVVYLRGVVDTDEQRQRAQELAEATVAPRRVVNSLQVRGATAAATGDTAPRPASAPVTSVPSRAAHPVMTYVSKLERVDREGADDRGPWAAYGNGGRRVATVFTLPRAEVDQHGVTGLDTGQRPVTSMALYPHPGPDGRSPQYVIVLWHVDRDEAARLQ